MQIPTLIFVTEPSLQKQLGLAIRRHRLALGLSQEEFAHRCGVHRTYIGTVERGEKAITIETGRKIAAALDIRLSELFREAELDT